jgi:hypothetical protein
VIDLLVGLEFLGHISYLFSAAFQQEYFKAPVAADFVMYASSYHFVIRGPSLLTGRLIFHCV